MKVKELIEKLNKIEDKNKDIEIFCMVDEVGVEIGEIDSSKDDKIIFILEAE